jgi:outer membrane lipoprotein-sorting protein
MKYNRLIGQLVLFIFCSSCGLTETAKPQPPAANPAPAAEVKTEAKTDPNRIDPASELGQLLEKINAATKTIVGCQAAVNYLFIQEPDLLNSHTLRKGTLYYQKNDKGSKLRLNFDSIKQDEGEEQKKTEQYVFDGVWLTKIDYTLRQVDQYQQAPIDKPVNVLEYISRHFPIVGFSGTDVLEKQFYIRLIPAVEGESKMVHLELKVRPDSVYKDDYTQIDLWIHHDNYLPVKMKTTSIQSDIYEINLSKMELNKTLPDKIFVIETPADFSKNVKTLEQNKDGKGSRWPQEL